MSRWQAIAFALLASACNSATNVSATNVPTPIANAEIRYVDDQRQHQIVFHNGAIGIGAIPGGGAGPHSDFTWGAPTHDCSDRTYLCVQGGTLVFAVPRGNLAANASYVKEGVRFTVFSCEDAACTISRVRADCERFENDVCSANDMPSGQVYGTLAIFTYRRGRGVTAITRPEPMNAQAGQRYTLEGQEGILR
jgi:hypothetical protein